MFLLYQHKGLSFTSSGLISYHHCGAFITPLTNKGEPCSENHYTVFDNQLLTIFSTLTGTSTYQSIIFVSWSGLCCCCKVFLLRICRIDPSLYGNFPRLKLWIAVSSKSSAALRQRSQQEITRRVQAQTTVHQSHCLGLLWGRRRANAGKRSTSVTNSEEK